MRRLAALVLLCASALLPGTGRADSYAEISARVAAAQKGMETATRTIAQDRDKLQKAIEKAMQAEHFEGPHWAELDQALKAWSDTVNKQTSVMDGHARTLLKLAPSTSLPDPELDRPAFKPLLKQMEGIAKDLQASISRAEAMKRRYQQLEAQTQAEIGETAKGKIADIALDAIGVPTDAADLVATLAGAVSGGAAIEAAYGAAKTAWGLYYYLDEMKSAARVVKTARQQMAFADEFIQKTQASLASARQGIGFLERYMVQTEETLSKYYIVRNGWRKVGEESAKEDAKEAIHQFDEALAKPRPGISLPGAWPLSGSETLPASEFETEAEAILRELRSAAEAAVDGGSPLVFHDILDRHMRRLSSHLEQAQERQQQTSKSYQEAYESYQAACSAAFSVLRSTLAGCKSSSCIDSAYASYQAAVNVAIAPLNGPARAVTDAGREVFRLSQIKGLVQGGAEELQRMMLEAANARRQSFWRLWREHQAAWEEARRGVSASLEEIPDPSQWRVYSEVVNGLQERLGRGEEPAALRDWLREDARRLRMLGESVPRAVREYRKGMEDLRNTGNQAESELGAFLTRYGPLLRYHGGHDDYTQAAIDSFIEEQQNTIQQVFKVEEAGDYVDEARRFDYAGTVQRIEAAIAELDDWVQRLDTFRWRLGNSRTKLDSLSRTLTGQPAFAPRAKPLAEQAREELRSGAWSSLVTDLERLGSNADLFGALQARYLGSPLPPDTQGATPRSLLVSAQTGLHALAQDKMRHYLRLRPAAFHPVNEADMTTINTLWQTLKPLYPRFEALAASEREKLEALYAQLPDDSRLTQAYRAIPPALTHLVQYGYADYLNEVGALRSYLDIKREALRAVDSGIANELKDWIEGYPAAKADWERRQAEESARQEAERKRLEAEEAARQEAERRAAEAPIKAVRQLYADFAEAYQARNLGRLTRMMTPDWQASDGSDLNDLEDNLGNSFRVFDRIQFRVDNLTIQPEGANRFKVNYTVTISGQIFQMDMKHQETSNVMDLVVIGEDGQARIQSTYGGRLWLQ